MDFIKLHADHLVSESMGPNGHDRFSHPAFTLKIPKAFLPVDFDEKEKLVELEYSNGERYWVEIKKCFGKVMEETKEVLLLNPNGHTESLSIVGIDVFQLKRTHYWKLIFERDLPF